MVALLLLKHKLALELMRALAAQVKGSFVRSYLSPPEPVDWAADVASDLSSVICKNHGMEATSFEEVSSFPLVPHHSPPSRRVSITELTPSFIR